MNVGDRVFVSAEWSTLYGLRGVVIDTTHGCMVRLDEYPNAPLRIDPVSLTLERHEDAAEE